MKNLILILLLMPALYVVGQSSISSINAGAVTNNNLVYTVGEIFVVPVNDPNEANSGLVGAVSRINFFVTGIDDKISSADVRVFPNPTSNYIYFKSTDEQLFKQVFVYDNSGRLVLEQTKENTSIDLTPLPKGSYTIVTDNKNIKSFNIIKQ